MTKDNFDMHAWRMKQLLKESAFDPKKSDLDGNGTLSPYEKKRGMAIAKNMDEQPAEMVHNAEYLEEDDWMQKDDESDMAHGQLANIKELVGELMGMIKDGDQLDAWVQAKLTKAEDYLDSVYHYLQGEEATETDDMKYDRPAPSSTDNVVLGAMFNERRGDTDYKRAADAKRFGKKGEKNTFGAGVAKGEKIEKQRLRK
jgi:hypothetical protein